MENHGIIVSETVPHNISDFVFIHENFSRIYVVKAHQKVDNGRLSRTCRPDDGDRLSGLCVKGKIVQDDFFGQVSEFDVFEFHISRGIGNFYGVFFVGGFGFFVDDTENSLGGGKGGLKFADDIGKLIDRARKFSRIHDELRNSAQCDEPYRSRGHGAVLGKQVENSAENHDEGERKVINEVDGRAYHGSVIFRVIVGIHGGSVSFVEFLGDVFRLIVGVDRLCSRQHFFGKTVHFSQLSRPFPEERLDFFRLDFGENDGNGYGDCKDENKGL